MMKVSFLFILGELIIKNYFVEETEQESQEEESDSDESLEAYKMDEEEEEIEAGRKPTKPVVYVFSSSIYFFLHN